MDDGVFARQSIFVLVMPTEFHSVTGHDPVLNDNQPHMDLPVAVVADVGLVPGGIEPVYFSSMDVVFDKNGLGQAYRALFRPRPVEFFPDPFFHGC